MDIPAQAVEKINNLIVEDHYKGKIIFMILVIITVLGTFATSKMKPINKWGIPVLIIVIFGVITFTDCFGVFVDIAKNSIQQGSK
jgi:glucan phosphoethanolaminetransferase (alkaline phosphatase superfamily)